MVMYNTTRKLGVHKVHIATVRKVSLTKFTVKELVLMRAGVLNDSQAGRIKVQSFKTTV